MQRYKCTPKEVSFEWSRHGILSTDLKVRSTLHVSVTDSGSDGVKHLCLGLHASIVQQILHIDRVIYHFHIAVLHM